MVWITTVFCGVEAEDRRESWGFGGQKWGWNDHCWCRWYRKW